MSNTTVTIILKQKADKPDKKEEKTTLKKKIEKAAFLLVRITVNRKQSTISTKVSVLPSQWDNKAKKIVNHPNARQLNVTISALLNKTLQEVNKKDMNESFYNAQTIKNAIVGKDRQNIFSFSESYSVEVEGKREASTVTNYSKHMRKLEEFVGSRNITFEEIDVDFLNRYEAFLRKQILDYKKGARPLSNNYVHLLMRTLRKMFNAAKTKGITSNYPFDEYEFPNVEQPIKAYLTQKEIKQIEDLVDSTKNLSWKQAGTYLLFGCFTGLRISDWYRFNASEQITEKGSRILLRAKKNKEWVGMKISPPLQRNLHRMALLPLTIEEQTVNEKIKEIATHLKIKKALTSHCGRHTFAVTYCAELGMGIEVCSNLMGITSKTCNDNYYRVNRAKLDNATEAAWSKLK